MIAPVGETAGPVVAPPPLPAGLAAGPSSASSPLVGFAVDLAMAIALMLALSTIAMLGWVVVEGLLAIGTGQVDPQALLQRASQPPAGMAMIWITLFSTGTAALVVYAFRRRATAAERQASLRALGRPSTWGWALGTGLATLAMSMGIGWLGTLAGSEPVPTNEAMIEAAFTESPVILVLFATLVAPAYEELLFRRVLFGRLWQAGSPWPGLVLSSLAFALIHEIPGLSGNGPMATLQLWLTYALMGGAFAWVYRRTGTLWAAILAHALNNAIACALLLLGYS